MQVKLVTFLSKYTPYNAGETAGFLPHVADKLVEAGIAVAGRRKVEGAVPIPMDSHGSGAESRLTQIGDRVAFFLEGEGDQLGDVVKVDKKAGTATVRVGPESEHEVPLGELMFRAPKVEVIA
jgi:hypothetical protein